MYRYFYYVSYQATTKSGSLFGAAEVWRRELISTFAHVMEIGNSLKDLLKADKKDVTSCVVLNWQPLRIEDRNGHAIQRPRDAS
jgi:hypothetical protein